MGLGETNTGVSYIDMHRCPYNCRGTGIEIFRERPVHAEEGMLPPMLSIAGAFSDASRNHCSFLGRLSLDQQVLVQTGTLAQYSDLKLLEGMLCCHLCFCTNLCLGLPLRIVGYCWSDNSDNPIYVGESTLFSSISRLS